MESKCEYKRIKKIRNTASEGALIYEAKTIICMRFNERGIRQLNFQNILWCEDVYFKYIYIT